MYFDENENGIRIAMSSVQLAAVLAHDKFRKTRHLLTASGAAQERLVVFLNF